MNVKDAKSIRILTTEAEISHLVVKLLVEGLLNHDPDNIFNGSPIALVKFVKHVWYYKCHYKGSRKEAQWSHAMVSVSIWINHLLSDNQTSPGC